MEGCLPSLQSYHGLVGELHELWEEIFKVENCICKAIHTRPGYDTFHYGQWIFFLDEITNEIVMVWGQEELHHSVSQDHESLQAYPTHDLVTPTWAWWKVASDDMATMHEWFMNECERNGLSPKEQILFPHGAKPMHPVWSSYLSKVKNLEAPKKESCPRLYLLKHHLLQQGNVL